MINSLFWQVMKRCKPIEHIKILHTVNITHASNISFISERWLFFWHSSTATDWLDWLCYWWSHLMKPIPVAAIPDSFQNLDTNISVKSCVIDDVPIFRVRTLHSHCALCSDVCRDVLTKMPSLSVCFPQDCCNSKLYVAVNVKSKICKTKINFHDTLKIG